MNPLIAFRRPRKPFHRVPALFLLVAFLASFLSEAVAQAQAEPSPTEDWVSLTVPMAPGGDVMSLALAPSDVNVLYTLITTGNLRFFRSLDGGATWQPKALFPLESPFATKFAVNPANALTVYAYGSSGLQRSLDGGDSWTKIYPQSEIFTAVSSEILYTGSGVGSCGVDYEKNYFLARSDDGGETWLSSPLGCLDEIEQIAVLPSERDMIYLSVLKPGAPGGTLLKSIDGGLTWVTFTLPFDGAVSALLIDPNNSQILYASGVYGILKSMDGGETWEQISNKNMGIYHRLALSGGSLYAVEATTSKTPVYRSDDGGASWWVSMYPAAGGDGSINCRSFTIRASVGRFDQLRHLSDRERWQRLG